MKNKILAFIWMVIGGLASLWIGVIPVGLLFKFTEGIVGKHSPILGLFGIFLIILAIFGAKWFKYLFYNGMLWGYTPDDSPSSKIAH